jgi:hypothetical protein
MAAADKKKKNKKKKRSRSYWTFREPRNRTIRSLNNTYVLTSLIEKSLRDLQRNLLPGKKQPESEYVVPSSNGEKTVLSRDSTEISSVLENAYLSGIHEQAIIVVVALAEDYLQTTLRTVLRWFPQKLAQNVAGENMVKTVNLDVILEAENKDQLLSRLINKQMQGIFYGAPTRYFEYIEAVLSIKLPDDLKKQFVEIKATRDVIVHNSGRANETYLSKAAELARAKNNEKLPVNSEYFSSAISRLKKLIVVVYNQVRDKYGNINLPSEYSSPARDVGQ